MKLEYNNAVEENIANRGYTRREMFLLPFFARVASVFPQEQQSRFPEIPFGVAFADGGELLIKDNGGGLLETWCISKAVKKIDYQDYDLFKKNFYPYEIFGSHSTFANSKGELTEFLYIGRDEKRVFVVSKQELEKRRNSGSSLEGYILRDNNKEVEYEQRCHDELARKLAKKVNLTVFFQGDKFVNWYSKWGRAVAESWFEPDYGPKMNEHGIESVTRTTHRLSNGKIIPATLHAVSDLDGKIIQYTFYTDNKLMVPLVKVSPDAHKHGNLFPKAKLVQDMHLDTLTQLIGTAEKRARNAIIFPQ